MEILAHLRVLNASIFFMSNIFQPIDNGEVGGSKMRSEKVSGSQCFDENWEIIYTEAFFDTNYA